jgi:hypothetical protein
MRSVEVVVVVMKWEKQLYFMPHTLEEGVT